jgi:hypothetical protein
MKFLLLYKLPQDLNYYSFVQAMNLIFDIQSKIPYKNGILRIFASKYLKTFIELEIIQKEFPFCEKEERKGIIFK